MKSNKAFTFLEMLAVITILGILVTIVLISSSKLVKSSNKKYYHTQEKMMALAAKEYFTDYRSYLPKEIGEKRQVVLASLVHEKYLDEVKDVKENLCDETKSYVTVKKENATDYVYDAHLVCLKTGYVTEK